MDTFCVLPWVGREIRWNNAQTHCCLLAPQYDIDQVKSDLLAGVKTPACQKCWNLEKNGIKSDRQVKNAALDFYWNRDIENIKNDAIDGKLDRVLILKLFTSYTCNATCISCGPRSSSSWAQLNHRSTLRNIPVFPNAKIADSKYKFVDLDKVHAQVDFKELKMLSLIGGEPLYEKKNFDLLEHIIALGNTEIFLSIVTNGSVKLSTRQKQILSKFKNINFSVSIDGTESVFEYLRYPLKWKDLKDNLNFFWEISGNVSSNYTLSNLNILYHACTLKWFDENNLVYSISPVYKPTWLQPRALPEPIKKVLKQQLSTTDYGAFIGSMHTEQDQRDFQTMLSQINIQDTAKKIQMKDFLPELHDQLINWF
jgi:sulfatase maturation enzyme AslB (radical SAM superfamily)